MLRQLFDQFALKTESNARQMIGWGLLLVVLTVADWPMTLIRSAVCALGIVSIYRGIQIHWMLRRLGK
jgi:hypothetical protein